MDTTQSEVKTIARNFLRKNRNYDIRNTSGAK